MATVTELSPRSDDSPDDDDAYTPPPAEAPAPEPKDASPATRVLATFTPRRLAGIAAAWVLITIVGVSLVTYGVGPMMEQRDQHDLLARYRQDIEHAANAKFTPATVRDDGTSKESPTIGDPVAILEINALRLRQVVVEGVGPQQTRHGPGHVPGTAGPGQPSNSVVVGRQAGFGGPFSEIDKLAEGDEIVIVTTQGKSLYKVKSVHHGQLNHQRVYGPSMDDNRLTLVTSASAAPWSKGRSTVVVAIMQDQPFEATRQGARLDSQDGRQSDGSALAPVVLALLGYGAAAAGAVLLYRRTRPRSAYLISAPLLVASTVLIAEAATRLLPAWF
jgi:sortase A